MIIRKLIYLIFYLIIITAVVFVIFCIPLVKGLISCYDNAVLSFDDIEVSARSSGWLAIRVCQLKQDSIKSLEACVNTEDEKSPIPQKFQNYVIGFYRQSDPILNRWKPGRLNMTKNVQITPKPNSTPQINQVR